MEITYLRGGKMNTMKKIVIIILSFILLISLNGCQSADNGFPFDLIDSNFGLKPFEIPEDWDVIFIGYQLKAENEHEQDVSKKKFTDEPTMVQFRFGKKSVENKINVEIQEHAEKINWGAKTIYHVTNDKHYAEFWIDKMDPKYSEFTLEQIHRRTNKVYNEFSTMIEVNDKVIYASGKEGSPPDTYQWLSEDKGLRYFLWFYDTDLSEEELRIENIENILQLLTEEQL
jgi:hypothetical protein